MGTKGAVQYFLWFVLLSSIEYSFGRHSKWGQNGLKLCHPQDWIDGCICGDDPEDDLRHVTCNKDVPITAYVSKLKGRDFYKNANLDLTFFELDKRPNDVPSKLFEGLNVKSLSFHICNITKWSDELGGPAFVGLEDKLEYLSIAKSIDRRTSLYAHENEKFGFSLSHLRKLKEIEIIYNVLHRVYGGLFSGGLEDSLESVKLRKNLISTIADGTFSNLKNLKFIDLSENEIDVVSSNMFVGALEDSLEEVIFRKNGISKIADGAFSNLKQLRSLDLSVNKIQKISRNMFPDPALNLKELILSENNIEELPEDIFKNMPALIKVVVSGNHFSYLPEDTWKPVWSQLQHFEMKSISCYVETIRWMSKVKRPSLIVGVCKRKPLSDVLRELEHEEEEEVTEVTA